MVVVGLVLVAHLPVLLADALGLAQRAFDIGAGHPGLDPAFDHGFPPFAAGDPVAAAVLPFADHREIVGFPVALPVRSGLLSPGLRIGQRHGVVVSGRGVVWLQL
ncbi:hypothetical protein FQZ97_1248910 [compost metagenome]